MCLVSPDKIRSFVNGNYENILGIETLNLTIKNDVAPLNGNIYLTFGFHNRRRVAITEVYAFSTEDNSLTLVKPMNFTRCSKDELDVVFFESRKRPTAQMLAGNTNART